MKHADLKKIFRDFQAEKTADKISTDDEIINRVFKASSHHPIYKKECAYYVKQELNRLSRESREEKEGREKLAMEKSRMLTDPNFIAGAKEAGARYVIEARIHKGLIPKENLEKPIYKGKSPKDFGFGSPR